MHVRGDDDIARLAHVVQPDGDAACRSQIRQLEELSRVQRRFVSDVSHELRTPLTTVRMAGDVLHDARARASTRSTARAAELLQTELDRFETLLADLLEISRFDAGAAVLDLEDVNLGRRRAPGGRRDAGRWPRSGDAWSSSIRDRRPCHGRGRRTPGRADRAQPGHQRHRLRRRPAAVVVHPRRQRRGHRARRARLRRRAEARASPRWCSTGSGGPTRPGRAPPAAPGSACRSRSRTPGCTAAGCRPGASPAAGAQFRLTLPRRAGDPLTHSPLPLVPRRRPRRASGDAAVAPSSVRRGVRGRCWPSVAGAAGRAASTLPESGPVHRQAAEQADRPQDAPYFNPPGPAEDGSPAAIVYGLPGRDAGQPAEHHGGPAVPDRASPGDAGSPTGATIVYEAFTVDWPAPRAPGCGSADTRRLDARGGWLRRLSRGARRRSTSGWSPRTAQWRIDDPPERAGRADVVLRPQLPAVRPLLLRPDRPGAPARPGLHPARRADGDHLVARPAAGPGSSLREVSRVSAALAGPTSTSRCVVTESGVAEVPLSREVLRASPDELSRWSTSSRGRCARCRGSSACGSPSAVPPVAAVRRPDRRAGRRSGTEFDAAGPPEADSGGCAAAGGRRSPAARGSVERSAGHGPALDAQLSRSS